MDDLFPPQTIAAGLAALTQRWPEVQSSSEEEPIFVLAAGWRSGSTAVQRALMSQCFIWGEPFGHTGIIERLADPLRAFTKRWPEPHFMLGRQPLDKLDEKFIANLYPPPQHLLAAHLAWFDALFVRPSRTTGRTRWGIKEVRLSADHAAYLRWLYPRAKFIFLLRNPYDAFRSFAARRDKGWHWFHRWPSHPLTPSQYGRTWRELAGSFRAAGEALGGVVVRYEDLATGGWQRIESYVGFKLSQRAMETNPSDGGPPPVAQLATADYEALRVEVEPLAEELGYRQRTEDNEQRIESRQVAGVSDQRSVAHSPAPPLSHSHTRAAPASCPPDRCAVLVPVAERIEPACEAALRELEHRGYRVSRVHGYRQIDLARCQMASDALAAGCDETLWIDADTGFHPDAVDQLRSHSLPIVAGIYPKKSKRELAIHAMPGTKEILFGAQGGLVEILYAPTGFLLVRREVYDKVRQQLQLPECLADTGRTLVPYYAPLIRPDGDGWWYLADDFAFCERARQCGFKIMADASIRLWHIGNYSFGWEDAGRQIRRYGTFRFHLTDAEGRPKT